MEAGPKIDAAIQLIEQICQLGDQVVVFSSWTSSLSKCLNFG